MTARHDALSRKPFSTLPRRQAFRLAMEAFRTATDEISPNMARYDWIESALGFAESVAEQGEEGAAEHDLTAAIEILDKVLTVLTGGPQSRQRLSAEERLGILLTMRARRLSSEADYRKAIADLEEVAHRSVVAESWAVGVVRNLAVACCARASVAHLRVRKEGMQTALYRFAFPQGEAEVVETPSIYNPFDDCDLPALRKAIDPDKLDPDVHP
ncbi:hypothetical protein ACWGTI_30565 [Mesorhizobium sp. ArgA1]